MNPTILGVIWPGFLNQVPTLNSNRTGLRVVLCHLLISGSEDLGSKVAVGAPSAPSLPALSLHGSLEEGERGPFFKKKSGQDLNESTRQSYLPGFRVCLDLGIRGLEHWEVTRYRFSHGRQPEAQA